MAIRRALFLLAVVSLALGACSTSSGSPTATADTPSAALSPASSTSPSSPPSAAQTKVSANKASDSELVAALTAAGVPNADRWAREVMEYRPHPIDDPTLQKLQDNLAKYNPDPATLSGVLAALEPGAGCGRR